MGVTSILPGTLTEDTIKYLGKKRSQIDKFRIIFGNYEKKKTIRATILNSIVYDYVYC